MNDDSEHGGTGHNDAIDDFIRNLPPEAENIRKNQNQVDVNGVMVGTNRPDVQYDLDGKHYAQEFNTKNSKGHAETIKKNDPKCDVKETNVKQ